MIAPAGIVGNAGMPPFPFFTMCEPRPPPAAYNCLQRRPAIALEIRTVANLARSLINRAAEPCAMELGCESRASTPAGRFVQQSGSESCSHCWPQSIPPAVPSSKSTASLSIPRTPCPWRHPRPVSEKCAPPFTPGIEMVSVRPGGVNSPCSGRLQSRSSQCAFSSGVMKPK